MRVAPSRPRAFTLVEMLIVIAVILILLSLLLVGLNLATKTRDVAHSRSLMQAIRTGLVQFEGDIGYLPPVLAPADPSSANPDDYRRVAPPPNPYSGSYRDDVQDWYSVTTLAEYLIGYGNHEQDGYGYVESTNQWGDELPALGIRDPGRDGAWGAYRADGSALDGALNARMLAPGDVRGTESNPFAIDQGRKYGPYITIDDPRMLGSTDGSLDANGRLRIYFPGDADYDPSDPKVIVDRWGNPIRYFRTPHVPGNPKLEYPPSGSERYSLSDVRYLRPWEVPSGMETDTRFTDDSPINDPTTSHALNSAKFALFSPGPDRAFNADVRYDRGIGLAVEGVNEDNLVEVGP